jgi:RNA polymerase sigma factor for flagellar operon FliA
MDDLARLWKDYKLNHDETAKESLVNFYLPLVKQIAAGIKKKINRAIEFEDLVSDGIFGLLKAINLFEPERGFKFETYATQVIRGAIYNGLRALDWVPERTRGKARALQKAMDKLTLEHGRAGTEEELAEELKISAAEVYDLITDMGCLYLLSLDQPVFLSDEDEATYIDVLHDKTAPDPYLEAEFSELRNFVREGIKTLNERERYLIEEHYLKAVHFDKIAEALGLSKQRISQIHNRAVEKLKEYLSQRMSEESYSF